MNMTHIKPAVATARGRQTSRPPTSRRTGKPDPERLAELVVATWLEIRAGRRPLSQIRPLLAPALYRQLCHQLGPLGFHTSSPGRIRSVFACSPSTSALEASVLVEHTGRVTAIAVRVERYRGAWRVVEMTAPEAGLRPLGTTANWNGGGTSSRMIA